MDKQHALLERFFQSLVQPQKRKWRFSEATYFYKNLERAMTLTSLLLGIIFISSLCLILYAYQRNKEEIDHAQMVARQTKIAPDNFTYSISNLHNLVSNKQQLWHRFAYGLELADAVVLNALDKTLLSNTKQHCVPYMMNLVKKQLVYHLQREEWSELFGDLHVYLMLINKEPFDKNIVIAWFAKHKNMLTAMLPMSNAEGLLQAITPLMFENIQEDSYLYERMITALQSSAFAQSVYNNIAKLLSTKPSLSISQFVVSKRLLALLNSSIDLVTMPYMHTKEGYSDFKSYKKSIKDALLKIQHLREVLEIDQIKNSIEETTQIYKEAYEVEWNAMWARIRFKHSKDIASCLADFKVLSEEIRSVLNFIQRTEEKILIQNATDYLGGNEMLAKGTSKLKDLSGAASDQVASYMSRDRFTSYMPMTSEARKIAEDGMRANLAELVQCAADLSNRKNKDYACHKIIINVPKEESSTHKGLVLADTLSSPLNVMYKELVNNFDFIIHKSSASHINSAWHREVYSYYMKNIHSKYPFNINNYQEQLSIEDFSAFFAIGGKFNQFQKDYLTNGKVLLSSQAKKALQHFEQIQLHWFGENAQPKVAFSITNVTIEPTIKHVDLQLLGKQVRISSTNLGPNEFVWSNKGLEMAKVEFLSNQNLVNSIVYAGPWAWYKLLELEDVKGSDGIRRTLKACKGGIGFFIHFDPKFYPLNATGIQIPKYIAGINNNLFD